MKQDFYRRKSGFTLVEMLVAVGLAAIILAVVVTAFTETAQLSGLSHAKTEATHNARVAMEFLETELEAAYLDPVDWNFQGSHQTGTDWNGDPTEEDILIFRTMEPQTAGAVGSDYVQYTVADLTYTTPDGNAVPCLQRSSQWASGAWTQVSSVGDGVRSFNVRFYSAEVDPSNPWFDNWNSADPDGADSTGATRDDGQYRRMPELVEVTITVIDSDGVLAREEKNPITVRRLIELPNGQ